MTGDTRIPVSDDWHFHEFTPQDGSLTIIHTKCEPLDSVWDPEEYITTNGTNGAVGIKGFCCHTCKTIVPDDIFIKYFTYGRAIGLSFTQYEVDKFKTCLASRKKQ